MYTSYYRISSGNPATTLDQTARNVLGAIYSAPPAASEVFSLTAGASTPGFGAQQVYKYVYFYDAAALTGTMQVAPAPVYYIDESFTTITGNAADAYYTTGGACVAGYLMPNTTALGTSQTAAGWYLQLSQSYVHIQIGGLLPGALAPSTTTGAGQGSYITGLATGSWTSLVNTTIAASSRVLGIQWTAIASGVCDVLVGGLTSFWGS
jgi:hypothetical protein